MNHQPGTITTPSQFRTRAQTAFGFPMLESKLQQSGTKPEASGLHRLSTAPRIVRRPISLQLRPIVCVPTPTPANLFRHPLERRATPVFDIRTNPLIIT
jgi:hypothetical protein